MKTVNQLPKTVVQLFEEQALFEPDKTAVIDSNTVLTYEELNKKANQLASYLLRMGVKKAEFIPIWLDRSVNLIISVLGVLKAGCTYVPINNDFPILQIRAIFKLTHTRVIITKKELNDISGIVKCINLEEIFSSPGQEVKSCGAEIFDRQLAYLTYTSGTTGKPKGVQISHKNLVQVFNSWEKIYRLNRLYTHLQMADFSFDVFTGDWVRALCSGSKLVICPKTYLTRPDKLYQLILKEGINFAEFVPSVLKKLSDYVAKNNLNLQHFKILICGSDVWTMSEYYKVKNLCSSNCRIINSYGVTEATIDSTYFEYKMDNYPLLSPIDPVPIGKSFPHVKIYLLNKRLEKVNKCETGEIYIAGTGVSKGYFFNQKLTREKFLRNPFCGNRHEKFYKTGDYGYRLPDGNIVFVGRNRDFLKINGVGIDL